MRVAMLVALLGVTGIAAASVTANKSVQNLPGLLAYQAPRFPIELRGVMSGDGHVVMVLTIDTQGQVSDSIALAASHDAFAKSASEAIAEWRFAPTSGSTLPRREIIEFDFKRIGVITTMSHAEAAREGFISTSGIERRTVQWHELDAEPQRLATTKPAVSRAVLSRLGDRPLMINFIIDEQGRVRVPVISAAQDGELSEQVLAAVRQWRYSPPMHNGKPVAVEVTRSLVLAGAK